MVWSGDVVAERKALVRAGRREPDDVAVGADAAGHLLAELQQHAGRIGVRVRDVQGFVGLEVGDVGEAIGGIIDPRRCGRGFRLRDDCGNGDAGGRQAGTAHEFTAADIDHPIAMLRHGSNSSVRASTPTGVGFLEIRPIRLPTGTLAVIKPSE